MGSKREIEWTEFDGTPESLPESHAPVLISKQNCGAECVFAGYLVLNLPYWMAYCDSIGAVPIQQGDWWALHPKAPEAV